MSAVELPAWYEELRNWKQSNLYIAGCLGVGLVVMAIGSAALVLMNWAAVMAFAPFGFGCALATGCITFIATLILNLGFRGAAKAHLAAGERFTELADQLAEQEGLITRQGELIERQAKAMEQLAEGLERISQTSSNEVQMQRLRHRGE